METEYSVAQHNAVQLIATQYTATQYTAQVFSPAHTDDGASGVHPEGRGAGQLPICDGEEEGQRQEGSSAGRPSTLTAQRDTGLDGTEGDWTGDIIIQCGTG